MGVWGVCVCVSASPPGIRISGGGTEDSVASGATPPRCAKRVPEAAAGAGLAAASPRRCQGWEERRIWPRSCCAPSGAAGECHGAFPSGLGRAAVAERTGESRRRREARSQHQARWRAPRSRARRGWRAPGCPSPAGPGRGSRWDVTPTRASLSPGRRRGRGAGGDVASGANFPGGTQRALRLRFPPAKCLPPAHLPLRQLHPQTRLARFPPTPTPACPLHASPGSPKAAPERSGRRRRKTRPGGRKNEPAARNHFARRSVRPAAAPRLAIGSIAHGRGGGAWGAKSVGGEGVSLEQPRTPQKGGAPSFSFAPD